MLVLSILNKAEYQPDLVRLWVGTPSNQLTFDLLVLAFAVVFADGFLESLASDFLSPLTVWLPCLVLVTVFVYNWWIWKECHLEDFV